jgi:hypothetical protein
LQLLSFGLSLAGDVAKLPWRVGKSIYKELSEISGSPPEDPTLLAVRSVGAAQVLDFAWQRLGFGQTFGTTSDEPFPPLERAAFAIVANCALAGRSTAGVAEWVHQDVAIPGTDELAPGIWSQAAERLGEPEVREQLEGLALAHVRSQQVRTLYLVRDMAAPGTHFVLAVGGDRWPVLVREWPPRDDPEEMPPEWADLLSAKLSLRIVVIQPKQGAAPGSGRLKDKECPGYGLARYRRVPGDPQRGTQLIFVQSLDPSWPGRPADHVIEVGGSRRPPDGEVVCAYLDGLQVRLEFAEMLTRPLRAPFREHDGTAAARALVAWIALLLTRQVEEDTNRP